MAGAAHSEPEKTGAQPRLRGRSPSGRAEQRDEPSPGGHGTLYLWPDGILFLGGKIRRARHRPFTASLFFALSGRLRVRAGPESGWLTTRGALLAPNVPYEMETCRDLAILHLDPETEAYGRIAGRLAHGPVYELPLAVADALAERTRAMLGGPGFSPARLWDRALDLVGGPARRRRRFDPRIEHVLDLLKGRFMTAPTLAPLAGAAGLSEGRLRHLFSEQLGLPWGRYILWLRLRHAVYCWTLTRSLTEAAHAAGFADSAHLNRAFRSMFGVRPSSPLRTNGRVRLVVGLPSAILGRSADAPLWVDMAAALEPDAGPPSTGENMRWHCIGANLGRDERAVRAHAAVSSVPDLREPAQDARGY